MVSVLTRCPLTTATQPDLQPATRPAEPPNPLTWRAVLLGLFLVVFVATMVPYSDYIRHGTFLIGNHLPMIVMAAIALLCVVVNPILQIAFLPTPAGRRCIAVLLLLSTYTLLGSLALLWCLHAAPTLPPPALSRAVALAFAPVVGLTDSVPGLVALLGFSLAALMALAILRSARRLSTGEMTVAISMMLISCALPTSGFYRYAHPMLAGLVYFIRDNPLLAKYVNGTGTPGAGLPDWLFPAKSPSATIIDSYYKGYDPHAGQSLWGVWGEWLRPYTAWAFFIVPFFGAVLCFCALMRKQWVTHERLAFPLATVPLELMAEPDPGHKLNALWKSRLLWLGAFIPFGIHLTNGLNRFYPSVPVVKTTYDLYSTFSEFPWYLLHYGIRQPKIFFSIIGVTFFVPMEIAFSLWFFYVAYSVAMVFYGQAGIEVTYDHTIYQGLGMYIAYGLLILWIARHHLLHVSRSLLKPREPGEFLPYGVTVGALFACITVAVVFLTFAGMAWWMALAVILLLLFWCMIISRIVMEAGVLFVQTPPGTEPLRALGMAVTKAMPHLIGTSWAMRNWLLASMSLRMGLTDQRENLMPFAANAMRMGSDLPTRSRVRFFTLLAAALFLCLFASGATHHALSYGYGRTQFNEDYGSKNYPQWTVDEAAHWAQPGKDPAIHRGLNMAYGAAAVIAVGLTRLALANSPFHPIGLLMLNGWAMACIWLSVFLAWACKWVILRWGGVKVYQQARPFFMGLFIGESLAGILWATVGLMIQYPNGGAGYQILPL